MYVRVLVLRCLIVCAPSGLGKELVITGLLYLEKSEKTELIATAILALQEPGPGTCMHVFVCVNLILLVFSIDL